MPSRSLADRMHAILPSPTLAMTAKARRMKDAGIDVIAFAAGEPDFDTPETICDAAVAAIRAGQTRYLPSAGWMALREAVSAKFLRENHLRYAPDQVVVSCGAKHSLYNALMVTLNPGDEVLLLAPYWMTYADQVRLAGGTPVIIPCAAENDFVPTSDQLKAALTERTRAIILNSPSNPTGALLPHAVLKEIAALAIRHDLWVLTDQIYERLQYEGTHESIAALGQEIYERTITIAGCSKTYAMTGWRIGFAGAPREVAQAMSNLQDQVTSNATSFAQAGAVTALNLPETSVVAMRETFRSRRDLMLELLRAIPDIRVPCPAGAFYVFPDITAYLRPGESDVNFANSLLEEAHVALIPGSVFEGSGHLRLSYATGEAQIREGVARLARYLESRRP